MFGRLTPENACAGQSEVQILLVQLNAEARLEIARDHALAMHFKDARIREAAHQCRPHLGRIGARLGGEEQRLADSLNGEGDDDLVRDLGGLPIAVAADEIDVLAHQLEDRLHLRETCSRNRRP